MHFIFRYLWPFLEERKQRRSEKPRCVDSSATKLSVDTTIKNSVQVLALFEYFSPGGSQIAAHGSKEPDAKDGVFY